MAGKSHQPSNEPQYVFKSSEASIRISKKKENTAGFNEVCLVCWYVAEAVWKIDLRSFLKRIWLNVDEWRKLKQSCNWKIFLRHV